MGGSVNQKQPTGGVSGVSLLLVVGVVSSSHLPPSYTTALRSIELGRSPSVYTAAKLMSTLIYKNKDNLMGACDCLSFFPPLTTDR